VRALTLLCLFLVACGDDASSADPADPPRDASADAAADAGETDGGDGPAPDAAAPDAGREGCEVRRRNPGGPLASLDPSCGNLIYGPYANRDDDRVEHLLPDFSFAGYEGGGVPLPDVPPVVTVAPSGGDARAAIQAAIDDVSARTPDASGFRGAVLLEAGEHRVDGTLTLRTSGVVLRGEGNGPTGTVIRATATTQHDLIRVEGTTPAVADGGVRVTGELVPVGSTRIPVEATDAFSVGDVVWVERTPNETWVTALGMDAWGWTPAAYTIAHERRVLAVEADALVVDIPLVDALEARFGGSRVVHADVSGRIHHVGVESLRLVSDSTGPDDEDHGWKAVVLSATQDSWVRDVTAVHFGYATVSVTGRSAFTTVQDCAYLAPVSLVTGSRRYAFDVSSGIGTLFQRLFVEEGRHDFVTGARTTGPNVWLDGLGVRGSNDSGPHHRWSTGILLDNIDAYRIHVENREDSGTGHGWSGAQTLFWNSEATQFRCDAPIAAMNWAVGCVGPVVDGQWAPDEPNGILESPGTHVPVRSLYLQQLADRLGPAAVEAVTLPEQRAGTIWERLRQWRGQGAFATFEPGAPGTGDPDCLTGVPGGTVCCAASCGTCGGTGCSARPGGAEACCTGPIVEAGQSCASAGPPCVL